MWVEKELVSVLDEIAEQLLEDFEGKRLERVSSGEMNNEVGWKLLM